MLKKNRKETETCYGLLLQWFPTWGSGPHKGSEENLKKKEVISEIREKNLLAIF